MVFVTVRNHKSTNLVLVIFKIRNIRNHKVDTEHIVFRKSQTAVDNDDFIVIFDGGNINADSLKSPERNDANAIFIFIQNCLLICL